MPGDLASLAAEGAAGLDRQSLAELARQEFRDRQRSAQRVKDAGRWTVEQASERLLPWLAIAAEAGADLPELREQRRIVFPYARAGQVEEVRLCADDICPSAVWRAELARARDAALDREQGKPVADHSLATRRIVALCAGLAVMEQPTSPERIAA